MQTGQKKQRTLESYIEKIKSLTSTHVVVLHNVKAVKSIDNKLQQAETCMNEKKM